MIYYYLVRIKEKISDRLSTAICRVKAKLWNVSLGKCSSFSGVTIFRRYPGSIISIGKGCVFNSSMHSNQIGIFSQCMISTLNSDACIVIGDNCGFSGTVISSATSITIGNNVRCGANTLITDTDFHTDDPRAGKNSPVVIEDNVWLGYGVKILKGVRIGNGAMVGAGSIVTKDIPANTIAAGIPCKIIK